MPKLVVGLGNPGSRYAATRHNVGFMVVDAFAAKHGLKIGQNGHQSLYAEGRWSGEKLVLLKPQTYMNLSGKAVSAALRWYRAEIKDVLVIHDDMDLEPGRLRIRQTGSSGGQKGVQSIITELCTQDFARVRIGVGRPLPGWDVVDWVLAPFFEPERPLIAEVILRAIEAIETALNADLVTAMNRYNG